MRTMNPSSSSGRTGSQGLYRRELQKRMVPISIKMLPTAKTVMVNIRVLKQHWLARVLLSMLNSCHVTGTIYRGICDLRNYEYHNICHGN